MLHTYQTSNLMLLAECIFVSRAVGLQRQEKNERNTISNSFAYVGVEKCEICG